MLLNSCGCFPVQSVTVLSQWSGGHLAAISLFDGAFEISDEPPPFSPHLRSGSPV